VLVYPRWQRVPLPALNGGSGPLSKHLANRALGHPAATEFKSLRDYAVGDDLRMVHWKASARLDKLVIRETDSLADLHLTVVLDLWADSYSDDGFERAVSATASRATSSRASMAVRRSPPVVAVRSTSSGAGSWSRPCSGTSTTRRPSRRRRSSARC
jgi:uncharacterized protein (DUF58 family)